MGAGDLVVGELRPGRYAVAVGDEAIGFVQGNACDGFVAYTMEGTPVPGTWWTVEAAADALAIDTHL